MHENNLVHRDLKVDNILVVEAPNSDLLAKLTDFTITKQLTSNDQHLFNRAGNPNFMAPELFSFSEKGFLPKPTDIWSLGICIYVYVLEKLPFDDENP